MLHATENRRQHQVRVGIGAGQAVFDAQVARVRFGDADARVAVFKAPAGAARRVDHGTIATHGIVVGREDRHALRQQFQATGHGMAQRALVIGGQQVVALLVVEADMHVHAAARRVQVGFAHETGAHAVLERHATRAAAEQCGPVGGAQAVVTVAEVDLELPGAQFCGDHVGVHALLVGGFDHLSQHVGVTRQAFDVHVWLVVRITAERVAGELRQAVFQRAVEQVELQLEGHHRANAATLQALQHPGQHFAGLELDRCGGAVGADQHLPQRLVLPAHRLEGAGNQPPWRIGVTVVEAVVANRVQAALDTQQNAVLRQFQGTAGSDFFEHVDRVALAIKMPGDVQADQVDITHLRMLGAKCAYFTKQIRAVFYCCHHVRSCAWFQRNTQSTRVVCSVRLA
ncbi:hypothetical protein D3C78_567280 [compost metagenome]